MSLTPTDWTKIVALVAGVVLCALLDRSRRGDWTTRRHRNRTWANYGRKRGMPASRPVNWERANNEWRVGQTGRNMS